MSLSQRRAYARHLVAHYARRMGVRAPHVRFVTIDEDASYVAYATYDLRIRRSVVVLGNHTLLLPRWELRAILAHEVGHLRSRHMLRFWMLQAALGVVLTVALNCVTAGAWGPMIVGALILNVTIRIALPKLLYRGYEVEADLHADRVHAPIVRYRWVNARASDVEDGGFHRHVLEEVLKRAHR